MKQLELLFIFLLSTYAFAHNEQRVIVIHNKTDASMSIQATTAVANQYHEGMPLELEATLRGPEIQINSRRAREFSISTWHKKYHFKTPKYP